MDVFGHPFCLKGINLEKIKRVELLAPCGNYESFLAAMKAGADAVYLGLSRFGARANAGNFTIEELKEAVSTAHILDRKVYLTVNTLFKDREINQLRDFLSEPYEIGIDAVIVQDIGVMSYISRNFPNLPIHASTQAAITGSEAYNIIKEYGVNRIVPARELSISEIIDLQDKTGVETECFIHGALCYSYSGKCLFSSFLGGRSGNRGRCAGPCRLMYDGKYPLSMKDLCTLDILPELIKAGISSFKIEGRMKSPEYVYGVTDIYRKYIDLYYYGNNYEVKKEDKDRLLSLYTRSGNCEGYYRRHNGADMITIKSPSYDSDKSAENLNLQKIKLPQRSVGVSLKLKKDEAAVINVFDDDYSVSVICDVCPSTAQNHPSDREYVEGQIVKTGNTLFKVTDIDIELEDNIFISKGQLNSIRRDGLEAFAEEINNSFYRRILTNNGFDGPLRYNAHTSKEFGIKVNVLNLSQALKCLEYKGVKGIVIPAFLIKSVKDGELETFCSGIKDTGKDMYIQFPVVFRNDKKTSSSLIINNALERLESYGISVKGLYTGSFEGISFAKTIESKPEIIGDIHLYALNNEAVRCLQNHGLDNLTVPVEMSQKELEERCVKGEELIIYGRIPMMISAGCVYETINKCSPSNTGHLLYISDRKGAKLPVFSDCADCCSFIYNSVPLYLGDKKELIRDLEPSALRVIFTDETVEECENILNLIFGNKDNKRPVYSAADFDFTRGHINKGVD